MMTTVDSEGQRSRLQQAVKVNLRWGVEVYLVWTCSIFLEYWCVSIYLHTSTGSWSEEVFRWLVHSS